MHGCEKKMYTVHSRDHRSKIRVIDKSKDSVHYEWRYLFFFRSNLPCFVTVIQRYDRCIAHDFSEKNSVNFFSLFNS